MLFRSCAGKGGQGVQGDGQGVLDHLPEQGVLEEAKEMLHANPVGTGEALLGTVIPEGDLHAVHGTVQENDEVDQAGKQQQIPLPAFSQTSEQIAFSMAGKSVCGCVSQGNDSSTLK